MTYTPPEQPAQGGYQPYQPGSAPGQPGSAAGQPGSAPGYGGYGALPASTSRKLSMWGLILGISSIIIPIWINAIAGGVLSGIGLAKEPAGKTMAIWGLVTSILGFIWAFIFWPVVLVGILAAVVAPYATTS
ncbi:hypothetical protein [Agrococcus sp. DT81.2]|uniref:hypothetical protein n=1 Tax=Agrococcus sp. DT81.2 TaxID=3393414 RepID=UPI003CE4C7B2